MKITAKREELVTQLQAVIGVVERRQTMPILSNLLIKADDSGVSITATDLELEVITQLAATVEQSGTTTIPARKLLDICRGLPEGSGIQFEVTEQKAQLTSGRSRFTLATLPAEEFPFLGDIEVSHNLTIRQSDLKQLFERTCFAMAQHDVRYYLNGLLLVMQAQGLRAVATDGHRLALSDLESETGIEAPTQVIVPRKAITELQRGLEATESQITLAFSENHLQIQFGNKRFTTKLVDGRFPDYKRVIPEAGDKLAVGDRELLRQALGRAAILSNEKFKGVRLALSENLLRVEAQNPEHEQAREELAIEYTDEPVDIGFNVNYLMDALSAIDSDRFSLELTGPDSSGLIRADGDLSSQYVVMPMRL